MASNDWIPGFDLIKRLMWGAGADGVQTLSPEQVFRVNLGGREMDVYYKPGPAGSKGTYEPIYATRQDKREANRLIGYTEDGKPLIVHIPPKEDKSLSIPAAALNIPAESLTLRKLPGPTKYTAVKGDAKQKRKAERAYENDFLRKHYEYDEDFSPNR